MCGRLPFGKSQFDVDADWPVVGAVQRIISGSWSGSHPGPLMLEVVQGSGRGPTTWTPSTPGHKLSPTRQNQGRAPLAEPWDQRRLATRISVDLAWTSRLKELHEAGTLAALNAYRNVRVIKPTLAMATSSGHPARLERRAGRPMAVRNMTDFPVASGEKKSVTSSSKNVSPVAPNPRA